VCVCVCAEECACAFMRTYLCTLIRQPILSIAPISIALSHPFPISPYRNPFHRLQREGTPLCSEGSTHTFCGEETLTLAVLSDVTYAPSAR